MMCSIFLINYKNKFLKNNKNKVESINEGIEKKFGCETQIRKKKIQDKK